MPFRTKPKIYGYSMQYRSSRFLTVKGYVFMKKDLSKLLKTEYKRRLLESARLLVRKTKALISKVYPKGKHAPAGHPPGMVSGTLRSAIGYEVNDKHDRLELKVGVYINAKPIGKNKVPAWEYAKRLEFGASRLAPRPFFRPAWNSCRSQIQSIMLRDP